MAQNLYPLFLDLSHKPVLVVGAGPVGTAKTLSLVEAGAAVTVVAPEATPELAAAAQSGTVRWLQRVFVNSDLDGVYLVVAATGDSAVNAEVAREAAERRLFVNAVDDPRNATAYAASILRRGPLTVALSSAGRAPGLCRLLRELLETLLPKEDDMNRWMTQAQALRQKWQSERLPMSARYGQLLEALAADTQRGAAS